MESKNYLIPREDPFNIKNTRNAFNVPLNSFNCGGFALGIFSWLAPYDNGWEDSDDDDNYTDYDCDDRDSDYINLLNEVTKEEADKVITNQDTEYLLKHFKNLIKVNPDEVDPKDRLIAYRVFFTIDDFGEIDDEDFHFKVRIAGKWFEKNGAEKIHRCELKPNSPWEYSTCTYDGPIVYFKIKN